MIRAVYLRSRVARRLVLLFLVSALVPVSALAILAYRQVGARVTTEAEMALEREAKMASAILLDRLLAFRAEMGRMVTLDDVRHQATKMTPAAFTWIGYLNADQTVESLAGNAPLRLTLSPTDWSRLRSGRAWLGTVTGSEAAVLLAQPLSDSLAGRALVAAVAPERLWGQAGIGAIPTEGLDLCVSTADGGHLYASTEANCSRPDQSAVVRDDETVFLGFEFGAPSWQVSAIRPTAVVQAPAREFQSSFLLVVLTTIAAVFFLANVQVRRSMAPLDALTEATRELSLGNLSHTVQVSTKDEFQELAGSFNGMALSLRRQFGLLTTLSDLEAKALKEPRADAVRAAILQAMGSVIPDAFVTVAHPGAANTQAWQATSTGNQARQIVGPSPAWLMGCGSEPQTLTRADVVAGMLDGCPADLTNHLAVALPSAASGSGILIVSTLSPIGEDRDQVRQVQAVANYASLALSSAANLERLDEMSWGALTALARTIDAASPWTAGHSERVTRVAVRLGRQLGLSGAELDILHRGGLLHDIGKIGVPATILDKNGPLNEAERQTVNQHPVIGARILAPVPVFQEAISLVRWHHEKLDGSGYPDGLKAEQIPFLVRILTVADVYDALTADRPYRPAWSPERVRDHFRSSAGIWYDARVVEALEIVAREPTDLVTRLPSARPAEFTVGTTA